MRAQKSVSYTTTLTPAECRALGDALREIPWWEVRSRFGVSAQIARRAARGEEILTTTAALLRKFLSL